MLPLAMQNLNIRTSTKIRVLCDQLLGPILYTLFGQNPIKDD